MSRLTEQNIRGSRLKKGEIALHDNFESGNRPYKAFQMAKENYIDTKATPKNTYVYEGNSLFTLTSWHTTIRSCGYDRNESITDDSGKVDYRITTDNDLSLCKNYSENGDSDKGLWRAPNQREMLIMYIQNKKLLVNTISRTIWRYTITDSSDLNAGNIRFFGVNTKAFFLSNIETNTARAYLRCVRDVEIVE